jgi:hypothetical protein
MSAFAGGMTKMLVFVLSGLFGLFIVTACDSTSEGVVPAPVPSPTLQAAVATKSLPTPISPAQMITYDDLQVVMTEAEITTSYLTEFGSEREPSADSKFIWIHILLKYVGPGERDLPAPEHFSVLHGTVEFKPIYGYRKDHADYLALTPGMVQGQEVDAWLRFDIPADAELKDLVFVFLPESSQVSLGFSTSDYSWADHPIYLWACAP